MIEPCATANYSMLFLGYHSNYHGNKVGWGRENGFILLIEKISVPV